MANERGRAPEIITDYWGQPVTLEESSAVNEEGRELSPTDQLTLLAQSLPRQAKSDGGTARLREFLTQR